ncbi:MAG: hypothetical protein PSX81_03195 [bacterium]|nr:hypothetical protein [bacterium]
MKTKLFKITISIITLTILILNSCQFANSETSEIGSISARCLDSLAWGKICQQYSTDSIKKSKLLAELEKVKNHFIKPQYILYFKDEPEEIIGCDWSSIRVVYNASIANQTLTGLDPLLGNGEQKRIRNRVLKEIMKYQCEAGKMETIKAMKAEVPYAESHKNYPLKIKPEMIEPNSNEK